MNNVPEVWKTIASSFASSLFDGDTIHPTDRCYTNSADMVKLCRKRPDDLTLLPKPINRNDFIAGCYQLTHDASIEHLLVGLGQKHGNTVKVSCVYHGIGEAHSVAVPAFLTQAIQLHVGSGFAHEAFVFHNHPPNPINAIFDNKPMASPADRAMMMRSKLQPAMAIKSLLGGGRVRYLLSENGFVREFNTPDLLPLLASLSKLHVA